MTTQSELLSKLKNAPDGATHFSDNDRYYKEMHGSIYFYRDGEWRLSMSYSHLNDLHPLPQPIKENWFENGSLPPVGVECLFESKNGVSGGKGKVIYYYKDKVWIDEGQNTFTTNLESIIFSPLKSDREKCIDYCVDNYIGTANKKDISFARILAGQWYDAGLLRIREDK